jgi:hypothetical protein
MCGGVRDIESFRYLPRKASSVLCIVTHLESICIFHCVPVFSPCFHKTIHVLAPHNAAQPAHERQGGTSHLSPTTCASHKENIFCLHKFPCCSSRSCKVQTFNVAQPACQRCGCELGRIRFTPSKAARLSLRRSTRQHPTRHYSHCPRAVPSQKCVLVASAIDICFL